MKTIMGYEAEEIAHFSGNFSKEFYETPLGKLYERATKVPRLLTDLHLHKWQLASQMFVSNSDSQARPVIYETRRCVLCGKRVGEKVKSAEYWES